MINLQGRAAEMLRDDRRRSTFQITGQLIKFDGQPASYVCKLPHGSRMPRHRERRSEMGRHGAWLEGYDVSAIREWRNGQEAESLDSHEQITRKRPISGGGMRATICNNRPSIHVAVGSVAAVVHAAGLQGCGLLSLLTPSKLAKLLEGMDEM